MAAVGRPAAIRPGGEKRLASLAIDIGFGLQFSGCARRQGARLVARSLKADDERPVATPRTDDEWTPGPSDGAAFDPSCPREAAT
jgi:hypothetical protein